MGNEPETELVAEANAAEDEMQATLDAMPEVTEDAPASAE